jgi:hypothetical protein
VFALASLITAICWAGLFMVHRNEAKVLQPFGKSAHRSIGGGSRNHRAQAGIPAAVLFLTHLDSVAGAGGAKLSLCVPHCHSF